MGSRGVRSLSGMKQTQRIKNEDKEISMTLRDAIGELGTPATIEQAMARANEDHKIGDGSYMENCYNVVVAYELQRRGYNVKARGVNSDDNLGETIYPKGKNAGFMISRWTGAFRNAQFEHVGNRSESKTIKNLEKKIKSYGNGARGAVQFDVKGRDKGHVLNFENKGGKVLLVDAQENIKYNVKDVMSVAVTNTVNIVRTDKLRLSDRAKKSVRVR